MPDPDSTWRMNLAGNRCIVDESQGPALAAIISGSESDRRYWEKRFARTQGEVFRRDGSTRLMSVHEQVPRGNFLGTLCVWDGLPKELSRPKDIYLLSMLFGKGTRLSPFTQALGNCKPRFPTPYKSASGLYLNIGELSTLYSNLLVDHLRHSGFKGLVVKWGDEIVLPGAHWETEDYSQVDALRFAWFTQPTAELAREKEWILVDPNDNRMLFQLVRQPRETLLERARVKQGGGESRLGVNLGSLAVSYAFLNIACQVFATDLYDAHRRVDWDPYVWLALACKDEAEWLDEVAYQRSLNIAAISTLLEQFPDFFNKITRVRKRLEKRNKRPLNIKVLDYGEVFWTDFGQHLALRKNLEVLLQDSPQGALTRTLFNLPQERDARGNLLINATLPPGAKIRNSLIMDTVIRSSDSVVEGAILVGGQHGRVHMPQGGIAMFSTVGELTCEGHSAIAYHAIAPSLTLAEGGRHATLVTPENLYQLATHESLLDYKGENYTRPLPGNPISFDEAANLVDSTPAEAIAQAEQEAARAVLAGMGK